MNKNILLILFFVSVFSSAITAQNFTVTPNPVYGEANTDDMGSDPDDVVAEAHITNNTSDTLFMKWERIDNTRPDCWETAVCDVNLCYFPTVSTMDFILTPNLTDGQMLVHAYTGGSPGSDPTAGDATIVVKISNRNDDTDTLIVEYNFSVTGSATCITSVSEAQREALKVYPNPASDYFRLTETQEIEELVVYNILGRKVKAFAVNNGKSYDVSQLPNSVYLIGMIDRDQETVKTIRLQKH